MKIIQRGRQEGKTTELIREAARIAGSVIIVHNQHAVRHIEDEAARMGLRINTPLTMSQVLSGYARGRLISCFLIDNMDIILQSLVGPVPIDTATITRHYSTREGHYEDTSED